MISQKLGRIQNQNLHFLKVHSIFFKTALFLGALPTWVHDRGLHPLQSCQRLAGLKGLRIRHPSTSTSTSTTILLRKNLYKIQAPKPQVITPSFSKTLLNKLTTGFGTGTISSIPQAY